MNTLQANMAAIRKMHPALADYLERAPDPRKVVVEFSTSGHPIVSVDGIRTSSMRDPVAQAKRLVDGADLPAKGVYILMGFGSGYRALELMSRMTLNQHLYIVEPSPATVLAVAHYLDLAPLINDRVFWYCGQSITDFGRAFLDYYAKAYPEQVTIFRDLESSRIHGEYFALAAEKAVQSTGTHICDMMTNYTHNEVFSQHILTNLMNAHTLPGVNRLFGEFKGMPAVCVAAGPSLDKNVGQLRAIQDHAVIICVGTVLKKLLKLGIHPHFVSNLDVGTAGQVYFTGLEPTVSAGTFLIHDLEANPEAVKSYSGRAFVSDPGRMITAWYKSWAGEIGGLFRGGTVAQMNLALAQAMGCDPVILVGQDLAYIRGKPAHAEGCNEVWGAPAENFTEQECMRQIRDWHGIEQAALSDAGLVSFLVMFEQQIGAFMGQPRVLNCTEGGAWIGGCQHIPLAEAIKSHVGTEEMLVSIRSRIEGLWLTHKQRDPEELREKFRMLLAEIAKLPPVAAQYVHFCDRLERAIAKKDHNKVEYLRGKANALQDKINAMGYGKAVCQDRMICAEIYTTRAMRCRGLDKWEELRVKTVAMRDMMKDFIYAAQRMTEKIRAVIA